MRSDPDTPASSPLRVLFVCSGNICRSPLAAAVFRQIAHEAGHAGHFEVDSAGIHGYHEGEPADPRTRRVARRHGVAVDSRARRVEREDLESADLIVALDRSHRQALLSRTGRDRAGRIRLLREFDPEADGEDVPDPYYGDEGAFERVHEIVTRSCRGLLAALP